MAAKRIGTIIHGALGDCYEQLLAIKLIRESRKGDRWIGFFSCEDRLGSMKHFNLDMLDEVRLAREIPDIDVDHFFQFQILDIELTQDILSKLPARCREKFDFKKNVKPWQILRSYDYAKGGLELALSDFGKNYLPLCMKENKIDPSIFGKKPLIGYLWRYRRAGGAVTHHFQKAEEWILKTKSELFKRLIGEYGAHILVCGMNKPREAALSVSDDVKHLGNFVEGEYLAKYTDARLNIPSSNCTYLNGYGYAAEMDIMSRCSLLIMMPSGFSEALWMKRRSPVVLVDPPPAYIAKLWYNRMPFFNNYDPKYASYNAFVPHTAANAMHFLRSERLIPDKQQKEAWKKDVCTACARQD